MLTGGIEAARKRAPCIIYVDELDAMASNRNNVMQNSNMAINQLLAELDGFEQTDGIVFIGSTNRLDSLDPAVIRPGRVDKLINVPLPDKKGRNTVGSSPPSPPRPSVLTLPPLLPDRFWNIMWPR